MSVCTNHVGLHSTGVCERDEDNMVFLGVKWHRRLHGLQKSIFDNVKIKRILATWTSGSQNKVCMGYTKLTELNALDVEFRLAESTVSWR